MKYDQQIKEVKDKVDRCLNTLYEIDELLRTEQEDPNKALEETLYLGINLTLINNLRMFGALCGATLLDLREKRHAEKNRNKS